MKYFLYYGEDQPLHDITTTSHLVSDIIPPPYMYLFYLDSFDGNKFSQIKYA